MHSDVPCVHIHFQDVVICVIGDEHEAFAVETDAVADASRWEFNKNAGCAVGCHLADGVLPLVVNSV